MPEVGSEWHDCVIMTTFPASVPFVSDSITATKLSGNQLATVHQAVPSFCSLAFHLFPAEASSFSSLLWDLQDNTAFKVGMTSLDRLEVNYRRMRQKGKGLITVILFLANSTSIHMFLSLCSYITQPLKNNNL